MANEKFLKSRDLYTGELVDLGNGSFAERVDTDTGSPAHAFEITPSDTADLAHQTRAIYVGGNGDVNLVTAGGETVLFKALTAGTILPIKATRVLAASTSPNMNLVGLY
ncbi:MAG TPA: hypothetical protein VMT46_19420 [Anaerolineaceae bacterium]|nr:hypothetical protein [Anaerolineaceae bacterium]